jgi:hypothetical protein
MYYISVRNGRGTADVKSIALRAERLEVPEGRLGAASGTLRVTEKHININSIGQK